ncbi:MAG TPA: type II secretion system inner membrane protein GspF [Polyangia bacterium]|nr:type II secretion system inner membrane protein GspF [Polyangia bacterium]
MSLYAWKGLDGAGKVVGGTRDADGAKALRQALRKDGVFITELTEVLGGAQAKGKAKGNPAAGGRPQSALRKEVNLEQLLERVNAQEIAVLTRQIGTLLKAGIPLAETLGALSEQSDNKKLERILAGIRQKVNEGTSLGDALAEHPTLFEDLYVNMVRSGEAAGNLDAVLMRLADFLDAQNALKAKVSGALTYPIIMMVLGSIVMGVLLIVVVPQITAVFEDMGKTLPWNTRLLIVVSTAASGYWWLLLPLGAGLYYGFRRWSRTPGGRATLDRTKLRMWLIGPLTRYVGVARFARTLSTMLSAGVPVLSAMEITKKVLNNTVLEKVVEQARDAIREGESIAATLKKSAQFPSMMVHMVAVGERSGQLEAMLENVAGAYEREVEGKVARLTTILSPAIIVTMAVVVVFIVFSILTPILDMQNFVQ